MSRVVEVLRDISLQVKYARYAALRSRRTVQKVAPVEQRRGIWSGSNELGYYLEIEGSTDLRKSVLKLSEWGMPKIWTIMLGVDTNNVNFLTTPTVFGLIAELAAGAGGTTQEVEVDWVNGTCVSLPMNALSVIVRYDQELAGIPVDYGTLRTRVTLCEGVRPGGIPPIRTLHNSGSAIASGSFTQYVEVPAFARKLAVYTLGDQQNILFNPANRLYFTANHSQGNRRRLCPWSTSSTVCPKGS